MASSVDRVKRSTSSSRTYPLYRNEFIPANASCASVKAHERRLGLFQDGEGVPRGNAGEAAKFCICAFGAVQFLMANAACSVFHDPVCIYRYSARNTCQKDDIAFAVIRFIDLIPMYLKGRLRKTNFNIHKIPTMPLNILH